MACYRIVWKQSARKELRKIPKATIARIVALVDDLAENPVPPGVKKLAGTSHTYRIRTGNYRVVYNIDNHVLVVEIVRVGHRKEVYRAI